MKVTLLTTESNTKKYSEEVLKKVYEQLKTKTLYGEFGQRNDIQVNLENVCSKISNVKYEDGNLIADVEFVGKHKDFLNQQEDISFGLRALENKKTGELKVIAFDVIEGLK